MAYMDGEPFSIMKVRSKPLNATKPISWWSFKFSILNVRLLDLAHLPIVALLWNPLPKYKRLQLKRTLIRFRFDYQKCVNDFLPHSAEADYLRVSTSLETPRQWRLCNSVTHVLQIENPLGLGDNTSISWHSAGHCDLWTSVNRHIVKLLDLQQFKS